MDLDAAYLLPTVDAALKAARRRAAGSAIDDHSARFRRIPGAPPVAAQPVEPPAPQAEPGPAGKQSAQRTEADLARQSDGPPLHAAKAETPDHHDGVAQRRSGQGWLWPRSHRLVPSLAMFRQHFRHEHV